MFNPQEARLKFNSMLAIMLAGLFWPFIGAILMIAGVLMDMRPGLLGLTLFAIWLVLIIWLIVQCWKMAPELGVTPWTSLWILMPFAGPFLIGMFYLEPLKYLKDNKSASERLPLTWSLIKESWKFNKQTWETTIKTSVWYLYLALAVGVSGLIVTAWRVWATVHIFVAIAVMVATLWIGIKLFLEVASLLERNKITGKENEQAKQYFGPYLWVAILSFLITAGPFMIIIIGLVIFSVSALLPIFGGNGTEITSALQTIQDNVVLLLGAGLASVIAVIASWVWMIYKSIQYALSIPALLIQNKHGLEALRESARIVKRRWWGFFWKNQLWGMVIGGLVLLFLIAASIIIMIPAYLFSGNRYGNAMVELLAQGAQGGLQMFLMPLTFIFIIKLYQAFKKTAK